MPQPWRLHRAELRSSLVGFACLPAPAPALSSGGARPMPTRAHAASRGVAAGARRAGAAVQALARDIRAETFAVQRAHEWLPTMPQKHLSAFAIPEERPMLFCRVAVHLGSAASMAAAACCKHLRQHHQRMPTRAAQGPAPCLQAPTRVPKPCLGEDLRGGSSNAASLRPTVAGNLSPSCANRSRPVHRAYRFQQRDGGFLRAPCGWTAKILHCPTNPRSRHSERSAEAAPSRRHAVTT